MTRVLLVEDSEDVLCVLKLELEWLGYEVDAVTDAAAALTSIQKKPPEIVVSDLGLPEMDGLEFIRRARKIPGMDSVPAIALTGSSQDRDIKQAIAAGFTSHLTKPVEGTELGKRIELLTSRRLQRKAS